MALLGHEGEELLDDGGEFGAEKFVGLVHDEGGALAEVGDALAGEVENTAGGSDEDVDGLAETHDVVAEGGSAGGDHDLDAGVLAKGLADLGGLEGELAGRDEEEGLDLVDARVHALEGGDDEGGRLAGPVLGTGEDVATGEGDGDGLFLDGRGSLELRARGSATRNERVREQGEHTPASKMPMRSSR